MSDDRELSDLYRSADRPQPSAALDAAIRAAARQPLKPRRRYALQWLGGVAATVFAALLIVQLLPLVEQQAGYDSMLQDAPAGRAVIQQQGAERMLHDAPAVAPAPAREVHESQSARPEAAARSLAPKKRSKSYMAEDVMSEQAAAASLTAASELELIEKLLEAGKTDEAQAKLKAFRQRYPDDEIPESLLHRLQQPGTSR